MTTGSSNLTRQQHPMPEFVRVALQEHNLMAVYGDRPAYQQNDYLGWIIRAKQQQTKEKRLQQMIDELEAGGVYMKMAHSPSQKMRKTQK